MATQLTGEVELKRIWEFVNKILNAAGSDNPDYKILIDKQGEDSSFQVSLSQLEVVLLLAEKAQIIKNTLYQPTIPVIMVGGIITLSPQNRPLSLFRPRQTVGTRTINANFSLWFIDLVDAVDIHAQFVFTGTIIITFQPGFVNVVVEELPTIYSWDAGLEQLTVTVGTDDKVELSFLVDPDDSNTLTLRAGGVAV